MMKRMIFVLTILVCSLFASAALAAVPTDFSYRGVALGDTEARLLQTLGERMKRGCFTVVDATNIRGRDMTAYKKLANEYKYRIYVVDFTDITLEEAKKRNMQREEYKQVPENVIERMYAQLADNKVPSGITVIKPEDLAQIWYKPRDLSAYKKVIHIGDIHGCYKPLKEYLEEINPQNYYIFLGDYIDRGSENA